MFLSNFFAKTKYDTPRAVFNTLNTTKIKSLKVTDKIKHENEDITINIMV